MPRPISTVRHHARFWAHTTIFLAQPLSMTALWGNEADDVLIKHFSKAIAEISFANNRIIKKIKSDSSRRFDMGISMGSDVCGHLVMLVHTLFIR